MSQTYRKQLKDMTKKERYQQTFMIMNNEISRTNGEIGRCNSVIETQEKHIKILRWCLWASVAGLAGMITWGILRG